MTAAANESARPAAPAPAGRTYDVIIVGLGAVGSAAAWQLAQRGARVLGLDRFCPPHDRGSSHGYTRITRLAVGEGPEYVPLVRRSHALWRSLEAATGQALFVQNGALIMGACSDRARVHDQEDFVGRTIEIARQQGIAHEILSPAALAGRFPAFAPRGDERCYFEPEAGFLRPEACVAAQLDLARRAGARLQTGEAVLDIRAQGPGVAVRTARGRYAAGRCIVSAGAWLPQLMGAPFAGTLRVVRQTLHWFEPQDPALYAPERFPVFIWVHGPGEDDSFYGFPLAPGPAGVKIGLEQNDADCHPDTMDRFVRPEESALAHARHVQGRLRGLAPRVAASAACPYTQAPQSRFVVTRAPGVAAALVVSACSGHGFKHSAALGEALAQTSLGQAPAISLAPFGLQT